MIELTLRKKFSIGLVCVAVVSIAVLISTRLLGKAALFHFLEREHVTLVMRVSAAIERVSEGGLGAGSVTHDQLVQPLTEARGIAGRVDTELFLVEQWAFALLGFADIVELPHKDIVDIDRINADSAMTVTPELAKRLKADLATVTDNSNRFGPLVSRATAFVKLTAMIINFSGLGAVLVVFLMIRRATLGPLFEALTAAQRIARGDLSSPPREYSNDEVGRLNSAMDEMKENLARVVGDVRERSRAVATSMREMATGSQDLTTRTEGQATTLQETSASISDLSGSVQRNAQLVQQTETLATAAREVASDGGEAVSRVISRMNDILAASKKISEINDVINGIAFQTNLLALNAAVEAARAGDEGRGFAVVAAEVRSLAQSCSSAAKETAALIAQTVSRVETGVAEVNAAGATMAKVVETVRQVSTLTTEVSTSLSTQASGITQIDQAMRRLDAVTQQNASMAQQSAAVVEAARSQSGALVDTVGQFKLAA
jgi:methyl-accepting chemotaxis protein